MSWFLFQELRCREEEVTNAEVQQRLKAQNLRMKEQELAIREFDLIQRELNLLMQQKPTPTPHKRNGKFRRNKLLRLLKRETGTNISAPSGE